MEVAGRTYGCREADMLARTGWPLTDATRAALFRNVGLGLAFVTSIVLCGCAQGYPNLPLEQWQPDAGYRATVSRTELSEPIEQSDELLLMLSFSGGGTRAAAFAYGVLEVLAQTEVQIDGRTTRLLDEVDVISSVSGGSFTAAYYGLFGDRIFQDFEEKFLNRNFHRAILSRFFLPHNWIRFLSPRFGRSDLAAAYYDRHLFEGRTFGDLEREGRVGVLINAADMPIGGRFGFVQNQFDAICSDLNSFPIARAVAASAAVPVVMTPIVLRNYAGSCGYVPPEWMNEAIEARDSTSRRFHFARAQASYLDAEARPYVHLVDGGIADNLGVRGFLDPVVAGDSFWQVLRDRGFKNVRRVVLIVVDAETAGPETSGFWQLTPGFAQVVDAVSDTQIRLYSYETIDLLRTSFERWRTERAEGEPARETSFFTIHVAFEALRDANEREYLSGLSSTLHLSEEAVRRLRFDAAKILESSVEFQEILKELAADPTSLDSAIATDALR